MYVLGNYKFQAGAWEEGTVLLHQVIENLRMGVMGGKYEKLRFKKPEHMEVVQTRGMTDLGAQMVLLGEKLAIKLGVHEDEML